MTVALVEPALYIFSARALLPEGGAFEKFWSLFEKLRSLIETNRAQLHCNDFLHDAVRELFPWSEAAVQGRELYYSAAGHIIRFLDRWLIRPIWEYDGRGETVAFDPPLDQHGIYEDEYVSLAWRDQLARYALNPNLISPSGSGELLATREGWSCLTQAMERGSDLTVSLKDSTQVRFRPIGLDRDELPSGWIDPIVLARLRHRRATSRAEEEPDIDFEKTGHGPSIRIKRAIELIGSDVRDLVVRIASDWHAPETDSCKLEPDAEPDKLRYRIGTGQEVLKGIIQTRAQDEREQAVALSYIRPFFLDRCRSSGFNVLPE